MIDQSDYQMAWQAYLGCGVLAAVVWFFILRRLSSFFLRWWLFLAGLAFLFTPTRHPTMPELWVPANVGGVLALMTDGVATAMPMLLIVGAGQIVALILAIACHFWLGGAHPPKEERRGSGKARNAVAQRIEPAIHAERER